MSSNNSPTTKHTSAVVDAATDINWEEINWRGNCDKCHAEYDALESGHIYLCNICVDLFPDETLLFEAVAADYASMTATNFANEISRQLGAYSHQVRQEPSPYPPAPTPSAAFGHEIARHLSPYSGMPGQTQYPRPPFQQPTPTPKLKQTTTKKPKEPLPEKKCARCTRVFRQNRNNNGIECTYCCNHQAALGYNLFAREGMKASARAAKILEGYYDNQQSQAAAANLTPSPDSTALTASAPGSGSSSSASPATPMMNEQLKSTPGSLKRPNNAVNHGEQAGEHGNALKRTKVDGWFHELGSDAFEFGYL